MSFFEDIGTDDETLSRPIWGVFGLLKDNLERLIAINIAWSLHLVPGIIAFGFPELPSVLRVLLILYTATVLVPATGLLFRIMARVCQYETPSLDMVKEEYPKGHRWRGLIVRSFLQLAPLFGLLGMTLWLIQLATPLQSLALDVLLRFSLLLLVICSLYWGPLFVRFPDRSSRWLLCQSALLVWRYPAPTALTGIVVLLALLLGAISIGGLFLIVPVLVALLQTRRCFELLAREQRRIARSSRRSREAL